MQTILLKNIASLISDSTKPQQKNMDLIIEGNIVKQVEKTGKITIPSDCKILDCSHHVVTPGFVNTHHHFYQTLTRNMPAVQDSELFDWLVYLYEVWKNIDSEAVYYSSLSAMAELLKTGCTCSTDHHYLYPRNFDGDIMALQFKAADQLGMRFSPTRGSMSLSRKDGGLPPDSVVQSEDTILADSERCIRQFHDPSPLAMHKIVLAPCSPFSVTRTCMRDSAALARRYGVRLHTHLCETKDEESTCQKMYGVRPLELMAECDLIGNDVFYAHGIHFNDEELRLLKETGSSISHCPSSNMRLGSGICRVRDMLDLGITVGIGVDGSASNDSSDMLGELRNTLLLQRVRYGARALSASEVYTMATINGAKMLNFSKVGKLESGWAADMAVFDVDSLAYIGSQSDLAASLLFCGDTHTTAYTIVNGRIVVDKGGLVGFDEQQLTHKANEIAKRLYEKAEGKY
ncbi:MAG: 8-oxoguanine deaminase [Sphaerochaetaceae bacterium]